MALTDHARNTITELLDNHRIVLFMKGSPSMPQCGFSAKATGILGSLVDDYATFNVLEDEEVREGIKEFGRMLEKYPNLYGDNSEAGEFQLDGHQHLKLVKVSCTDPGDYTSLLNEHGKEVVA